jgi:hypothetical protein
MEAAGKGRIEGTAEGGKFAGAEDGEGAVRWRWRLAVAAAMASRGKRREKEKLGWPTASHTPRRGVRPRVGIDQGGGQEDPTALMSCPPRK